MAIHSALVNTREPLTLVSAAFFFSDTTGTYLTRYLEIILELSGVELDDVETSDVELDDMELDNTHISAEAEVLLKGVELLLSDMAKVNLTVLLLEADSLLVGAFITKP